MHAHGLTLFLEPISDFQIARIREIPWITHVERTKDASADRQVSWDGDENIPIGDGPVNMEIGRCGGIGNMSMTMVHRRMSEDDDFLTDDDDLIDL
jgi:hypothetical protein